MPPYTNPELRAADTDRERVVAALARNFRDGRLGPPEYAERVGTALGATTVRELDALLTDLPPIDWPALPLPAAPTRVIRSNPIATASLWLGILSLLACGVPAALAIPLGMIGLAEEKRNADPRPATAQVGIVLGVLGAVLWSVLWLRTNAA
ncbi:DUF1707 and DUF4190 domain-containing protein [Nocardia sp. NPDC050697]|uniref:DUF1707 and DUF4190 domain-containing protein n=1 Tax=Nocardia sp. NPDC050697 TaxID=3155158 RepID=UPI0033C54440